MEEFQIGDVVVAVAGREMGEVYIVANIEEGRLKLVNGKARKFANPKRKNKAHVQKMSVKFNELEDKIKSKNILDAEVRKIIKGILKGD